MDLLRSGIKCLFVASNPHLQLQNVHNRVPRQLSALSAPIDLQDRQPNTAMEFPHQIHTLRTFTVMELLKIRGIYVLDLHCVCEFFDSIPQDQWKINDPAFIKQSEAITKSKDWIIEQIT